MILEMPQSVAFPRQQDGGAFHYGKKKVVRLKFRPDREKMEQHKCISEHTFRTIKRAMGASYFLMKDKRKVSGEFALMAVGYNLPRVENMFPFEELIEKVGRKTA